MSCVTEMGVGRMFGAFSLSLCLSTIAYFVSRLDPTELCVDRVAIEGMFFPPKQE